MGTVSPWVVGRMTPAAREPHLRQLVLHGHRTARRAARCPPPVAEDTPGSTVTVSVDFRATGRTGAPCCPARPGARRRVPRRARGPRGPAPSQGIGEDHLDHPVRRRPRARRAPRRTCRGHGNGASPRGLRPDGPARPREGHDRGRRPARDRRDPKVVRERVRAVLPGHGQVRPAKGCTQELLHPGRILPVRRENGACHAVAVGAAVLDLQPVEGDVEPRPDHREGEVEALHPRHGHGGAEAPAPGKGTGRHELQRPLVCPSARALHGRPEGKGLRPDLLSVPRAGLHPCEAHPQRGEPGDRPVGHRLHDLGIGPAHLPAGRAGGDNQGSTRGKGQHDRGGADAGGGAGAGRRAGRASQSRAVH